MEWARAKNILIAVLLAVNAFLYYTGASVANQKTILPPDYLDNAVALLEREGVTIARTAVPSRRIHLPAVTLSMLEALYPLARTALGDAHLQPELSAEGAHFHNAAGSFMVYQAPTASFSYRPAQPISDLSHFIALLQRVGLSSRTLSVSEEGDRATCLLHGVQLLDFGVRLSDGEVTGRLPLGALSEERYTDLLDPPNALLRFARYAESHGWGEQQVEGIDIAYYATTGGAFGMLVLNPGYLVQANGGVWLVDAVQGGVYAEKLPDSP